MPHYTMEPKPAFATGCENTQEEFNQVGKEERIQLRRDESSINTIVGNISQRLIFLFFGRPAKYCPPKGDSMV